ncbi:MAG TPA: DUF1501 domain-containing protein [Planctomycetaceae bacterium]|nr:DUF1501 domain-containing protein [Planctomycetaceae bacterium]
MSNRCQPIAGTQRSRREVIKIGGTGTLGISLFDLLRAEAATGAASSGKSVINIHLDGGAPQHDTIDPKPNAPAEIRGELQSIATAISGFHVSELMPKVAALADRIAFIRSLVGSAGAHDAFQCQSGFKAASLRSIGGRPAVGCVISKLLGSSQDQAPSFVDLMQGRPLVRDSARPGFLGPTYLPFRPDISQWFTRQLEPGMQNELARLGSRQSLKLTLSDGLTLERLDDRMKLLAKVDRFRRDLDRGGSMDAMDQFGQQAVQILTSGRLASALDLDQEPRQIQELYTLATSANSQRFYTSEDGNSGKKLLLARRLVEAGVRCVSVSFSDFDTHSQNFPRMRDLVPIVDHALHALLTDLDARGMLDDVTVVVWGEFGRTPRINKAGGRDHWPAVSPAMMFGGGIRGGVVIGETDRLGGEAISRPVTFQEVFATVYNRLGIDAASTVLTDPTGRPQFVLDDSTPIQELV